MVAVARVARTGADDDEVEAVEARRAVVLVPDDGRRHPEHREDVAQHVDEVVLAVEDRRPTCP